jgi:hypothetical protein
MPLEHFAHPDGALRRHGRVPLQDRPKLMRGAKSVTDDRDLLAVSTTGRGRGPCAKDEAERCHGDRDTDHE